MILFAGSLIKFCDTLQRENATTPNRLAEPVQSMLQTIHGSLIRRFTNIENNATLADATILDPRFKKRGFTSTNAADDAIKRLTTMSASLMTNAAQQDSPHPGPAATVNVHQTQDNQLRPVSLLWKDFDEKVVTLVTAQNPASAAILELRRYNDEGILARTEDPISWWRERSSVYPTLVRLMKKRLCIVATSVPCERIFSKTGQTITDRRSRLKPVNVQKVTFLNVNLPSVSNPAK